MKNSYKTLGFGFLTICLLFALVITLRTATYADNVDNIYVIDDLVVGDFIPNDAVLITYGNHSNGSGSIEDYARVRFIPDSSDTEYFLEGYNYRYDLIYYETAYFSDNRYSDFIAPYRNYTQQNSYFKLSSDLCSNDLKGACEVYKFGVGTQFSLPKYKEMFSDLEFKGWIVDDVFLGSIYLRPAGTLACNHVVPSIDNSYDSGIKDGVSWYKESDIVSHEFNGDYWTYDDRTYELIFSDDFSNDDLVNSSVTFNFDANKGDFVSYYFRISTSGYDWTYDYPHTHNNGPWNVYLDDVLVGTYETDTGKNEKYEVQSDGEHTLKIVYERSSGSNFFGYYSKIRINDVKILSPVSDGGKLDVSNLEEGDKLSYSVNCDTGEANGSFLYIPVTPDVPPVDDFPEEDDVDNPNTRVGISAAIFVLILVGVFISYFYSFKKFKFFR